MTPKKTFSPTISRRTRQVPKRKKIQSDSLNRTSIYPPTLPNIHDLGNQENPSPPSKYTTEVENHASRNSDHPDASKLTQSEDSPPNPFVIAAIKASREAVRNERGETLKIVL
jgi:hypothetical protein